ncbi:uncharacterized protein BJX67DRAFT_100169 [Aspergillus lucknowensis]|uniref:Secreted protein n=1 Tax=Aspergillus lucknowensis TaxID=176173 RepID=A0ABR4M6A9_9EURO
MRNSFFGIHFSLSLVSIAAIWCYDWPLFSRCVMILKKIPRLDAFLHFQATSSSDSNTTSTEAIRGHESLL